MLEISSFFNLIPKDVILLFSLLSALAARAAGLTGSALIGELSYSSSSSILPFNYYSKLRVAGGGDWSAEAALRVGALEAGDAGMFVVG